MAQQALSDMRRKTREGAKSRHEQRRGREGFGEPVQEPGMGDWSTAELFGLRHRAREHFGTSGPTRRLLPSYSDANHPSDSRTVH